MKYIYEKSRNIRLAFFSILSLHFMRNKMKKNIDDRSSLINNCSIQNKKSTKLAFLQKDLIYVIIKSKYFCCVVVKQ
jgi:hypothetical protein